MKSGTIQGLVCGFLIGLACWAALDWYRFALFLPGFSH